MSQEPDLDTDAADAFDRLCSKLSLLQSAVEGLTAARERMPDYSATLGSMNEGLRALDVRLEEMGRSRALSLSPIALAEEINAASQAVRSQDRRDLMDAKDGLVRSLGRVDGMIARGRSATGRARRELQIAAGGVVVGILLWSILPGAILRSLPESWHAPEWMAARMIGVDQAEAGRRMIDAANADNRAHFS
jgi:hypothetical protein